MKLAPIGYERGEELLKAAGDIVDRHHIIVTLALLICNPGRVPAPDLRTAGLTIVMLGLLRYSPYRLYLPPYLRTCLD